MSVTGIAITRDVVLGAHAAMDAAMARMAEVALALADHGGSGAQEPLNLYVRAIQAVDEARAAAIPPASPATACEAARLGVSSTGRA